jgi:hypothetical protein
MRGSRLKPDIQFYKKGEVKSQEKSGDILLWIDSLKYENSLRRKLCRFTILELTLRALHIRARHLEVKQFEYC